MRSRLTLIKPDLRTKVENKTISDKDKQLPVFNKGEPIWAKNYQGSPLRACDEPVGTGVVLHHFRRWTKLEAPCLTAPASSGTFRGQRAFTPGINSDLTGHRECGDDATER